MWYFVIAIVAIAVGFLFAPKPQGQKMKAGTIEAPTAKEGLEIPVLFGTRLLRGPNVVWYGDIKQLLSRRKAARNDR